MTGNPLILQERRSAASGSTLSDGASFFVSFHPVSGCYGSKMGAEIRAQSPRLSAGAGDLATAILVPVRPLRSWPPRLFWLPPSQAPPRSTFAWAFDTEYSSAVRPAWHARFVASPVGAWWLSSEPHVQRFDVVIADWQSLVLPQSVRRTLRSRSQTRTPPPRDHWRT